MYKLALSDLPSYCQVNICTPSIHQSYITSLACQKNVLLKFLLPMVWVSFLCAV